jgi:hypothetical protein
LSDLPKFVSDVFVDLKKNRPPQAGIVSLLLETAHPSGYFLPAAER